MIAAHLEPKGLAPDTPPLADDSRRVRKIAAVKGSRMLRDAILRSKGIAPPPQPKEPPAPVKTAHKPDPAPLPIPINPRCRLIAEIQQTVADFYGVPAIHMTSDNRQRDIARVRHVAMFLCVERTRHSIAEVGRRFNRDHTTVLHALKQVEKRIVGSEEEALNLMRLRERLRA